MHTLESQLFLPHSPAQFQALCLEVFRFQAGANAVYAQYLEHIGVQANQVSEWKQIPFLPIEFFKTHAVQSFAGEPEIAFTSSGTTGPQTSTHAVHKLALYEESFLRSFQLFYGNPSEYCILALLPGYLERQGSSLIYMAQKLIEQSGHPHSGFYLYNHQQLVDVLRSNEAEGQKTLLLGVSFALLDLIEHYQLPLRHTTVLETGGMKGRRRELTRSELHQTLSQAFGIAHIHSEYGMTELLSQAYSTHAQLFACPPWMQVLIRDTYDPFSYLPQGKTGGINVIDLANLYSVSFIETKDLGRIAPDGRFEVLGRFDHADVRGCNLLIN